MKILKYIVLVLLLSIFTVSASAQTYGTHYTPKHGFSTSLHSKQPTTDTEQPNLFDYQLADEYYNTTVTASPFGSASVLKLTNEGDSDFEEESDPEERKGPAPLGDGLWILLALALSYALLSRRRINE